MKLAQILRKLCKTTANRRKRSHRAGINFWALFGFEPPQTKFVLPLVIALAHPDRLFR